jgi:hypothetical protein
MVPSVIAPAGTIKFCDQGLERDGGPCALPFYLLAGRLGGIEAHDLMPPAQQALRHIGAHAAQSNHRDLHNLQPSSCARIEKEELRKSISGPGD